MHFEGSITREEEDLREPLYNALRAGNETVVSQFLEHPSLVDVVALPDDGENPTIGAARRLLRPGKTPLLRDIKDPVKWTKFTKELTTLVQQGDEDTLAQYHGSQPWSGLRDEYRKGKVRSLQILYILCLIVCPADRGTSRPPVHDQGDTPWWRVLVISTFRVVSKDYSRCRVTRINP